MITSIRETVLGSLREWILSEGDFVLRVGRIKAIRHMLDGLETEATRSIKPIDYPLYFFENFLYQYAACGYSDHSWFLIREDADPEILAWASSCCDPRRWYVSTDGIGSDIEAGKPHPLYPGFGRMYAFGNKVTPVKRYYKGSHFKYHRDSVEKGFRARAGMPGWTKHNLPLDVNGEKVY